MKRQTTVALVFVAALGSAGLAALLAFGPDS